MACRGNKRIMGGQEEGGEPKRPEGWRNWKTQRGMEGTEVRGEVSRAAEPWGTVAVREEGQDERRVRMGGGSG